MKNVLLVDDDRVILNLLAEGLGELGYAVRTACDGEEALELARGQAFDLAVLDLRMPGMSGLDLARALKSAGCAPFVFLSAFGDEDVVRDAAAAGALGYLVKPVDIAQLVPFIEAAIARGREIDMLRGTAEQLERALAVEQRTRTAVGILMQRQGLDRVEAFEVLRARARAQRRKVADVAEELIVAVENVNKLLREGG
jgi:two-component system, response regulator PdtaR